VLLIENHGDFEFKDLMAWLKKCHEGYLNEYSFSWCEFDLFKEIVKDAFDVAVLLRNTPWKEAEQVLKRFARTLNSQSPYHLDTEAYWGDI
jgi:leucyl aminopeptidase (aminopeptidase T)